MPAEQECPLIAAFGGLWLIPGATTSLLPFLLPAIGLGRTSGIVAGVSVLGLLCTVLLLPEPKGINLEKMHVPLGRG